jgi:hypothetical protein
VRAPAREHRDGVEIEKVITLGKWTVRPSLPRDGADRGARARFANVTHFGKVFRAFNTPARPIGVRWREPIRGDA